MTEEQLKNNIARNITTLRKKLDLTQAQLAEALNYSDKSVSKWERGDGIPDVIVLQKIAELFGVTLNDLTGNESPKLPRKGPHLTNKIIIPMLSIGLVFLVASVAFFVLRVINVWDRSWLLFIYAIPAAFIVALVFSELWWNLIFRFAATSGLIWSVVVCLRLSFAIDDMNFIFITAAILQVLTVLWFVMRYRAKKRKETK